MSDPNQGTRYPLPGAMRSDGQKKVVIAGASGLAGSAAVRLFASRGNWEVVGVSRRLPLDIPKGVEHIAVDLSDAQACLQCFGAMPDVTHVVYAALSEKVEDIYSGWTDDSQIARNVAMLRNLFDPLSAASESLQHIALVHGPKAYGSHLPGLAGTLPIPMRESLPRVAHPNFYYEQEDYLRAKQRGQAWSWTVLRPAMICGVAIGSPMNSVLALALFAALRKEAGQDLPLPEGMGLVTHATDADLVAEALAWSAESVHARNEAFNLANGDVLALHEAFPVIAEEFGMRLGQPRRYDLVAEIQGMAALWRDMVLTHKLNAPQEVDKLFGGSMQTGGSWTSEAPQGNPLWWGLVSTIKVRRAGFHQCIDTFEMLRKHVRRYRALRVLP